MGSEPAKKKTKTGGDKRVSLFPLSFEDALKALLQTKPEQDEGSDASKRERDQEPSD